MTTPSTGQVIVFEDFYIDARQRLLYDANGQNLPLPSRAFDTLLYMAEHPHELLEKQRLMKAVWPQAIVEENNLSQNISLLRRVLGESPGQHRFIVTVPGRGFRFVPKVRTQDALPWQATAPASAPPVESSAAPAPSGDQVSATEAVYTLEVTNNPRRPRGWLQWRALALVALALAAGGFLLWGRQQADYQAASIAVLAFTDMSPEHDQEYFSEGLSVELIDQLWTIPQLTVINSTSSFAFKGRSEDPRRIGQMLGVTHLLQGSVRKAGERVRVSAQLVDAASGSVQWSESYDGQLDDIFAIQDRIAKAVAGQLQLKMGVHKSMSGTRNVEAFNELLAGRAKMRGIDEQTVRTALPHLERAVALDGAYLSAKLWLVEGLYRIRIVASQNPAEVEKVTVRQDEVIADVLRTAPDTPEASLAQFYRAYRGTDLVEVERLLQGALQLSGDSGTQAKLRYALFLLGVGRLADSQAEMAEVLKNDPLDVFAHVQLYSLIEAGKDFESAEQELQKLRQLPDGDSISTLGGPAQLAHSRRDVGALRVAVRDMVAAGVGQAFLPGLLEIDMNDFAAARQVMRRALAEKGFPLQGYGPIRVAQWAEFFNDRELALQAVNTMLTNGNTFEILAQDSWRPVLSGLRNEPLYKKLLTQYGVVNYWRTTGNWGDFCRPVGTDDFNCR